MTIRFQKIYAIRRKIYLRFYRTIFMGCRLYFNFFEKNQKNYFLLQKNMLY